MKTHLMWKWAVLGASLLFLACGTDFQSATQSIDATTSPAAGACSIDEDCEGALVCSTVCDDWCDQTVWPNPCCENACGESTAPWACLPGGAEVEPGAACPAGTVEPARPADWVGHPDGDLACCLPDVACEENATRVICEAYADCTWILSGEDHWNNDGVCSTR